MTKKLLTILSILLLILTVSACKKQEQAFNDGEEKEIVKDEKESLTEDLTGKKKTDSVENVDEGKDESKIELKEEERKEKEVIEERTEEIKKVDTSNWKTYRSEEFGFEVKYPNSFSYKENHKAPYSSKTAPVKDYYKFGIFFSDFSGNKKNRYFPLYIDIKELPNIDITLDEMLTAKNEYNGELLPEYKFRNSKKTTINGQEFLVSNHMPHFLNAVTKKGNDYYIIEMGNDVGGLIPEGCDERYFGSLNSFKFIEK